MENFGPRKLADPQRIRAIAEIVSRFDIVAIQEVSDRTERVPAAFVDVINRESDHAWDYVASPRIGRTPHSIESFVFFFDTGAIEQLGPGALYPDLADDFDREPFAARFRVREGGATFILVTVHTAPAAALAEISALEDVLAWARDQWRDVDQLIVLGDFNAGCDYAEPSRLDALAIRAERYQWIVPDDADTNVAESRCAYDRIVSLATHAPPSVEWGVLDAAFEPAELDLSDHWPVWATFTFGESLAPGGAEVAARSVESR